MVGAECDERKVNVSGVGNTAYIRKMARKLGGTKRKSLAGEDESEEEEGSAEQNPVELRRQIVKLRRDVINLERECQVLERELAAEKRHVEDLKVQNGLLDKIIKKSKRAAKNWQSNGTDVVEEETPKKSIVCQLFLDSDSEDGA